MSHLVSSDTSTATLIDASGNFDVLGLYKSIVARLSQANGFKGERHEVTVKRATLMLDRVRIMRVFDYEGVVEGVDEMGDELDRSVRGVPKNTIGDSQEEAEDAVDLTSSEQSTVQARREQGRDTVGMVMVNNLSQVLNLVLKNNYAQGKGLREQDDGQG